MQYAIVEKHNHFAVHGYFDSQERANWFLCNTIPVYVARAYYMDKTLTANSFEVIEKSRK